MSIGVLVDSLRYAKDNCFIHQLIHSLKLVDDDIKFYDWGRLSRISLLEKKYKKSIQNHSHIISLCRQRIIQKDLPKLTQFLEGIPIVLYDQDPWNVYWDEYHTKGLYASIINNLNIVKISVPSYFWSKHISQTESVKTEFVRMGMLPKYCKLGLPFQERTPGLSFKGQLYEHRLAIFDKIESLGMKVNFDSGNLSYRKYLKYLHSISVFIHDESAPLVCNGQLVPRSHQMWHKDVEVASRGCFVIRDFSEESKTYDIQSIPTIFMYKNISEIPELFAKISNFSASEARSLQLEAVDQIRLRNDWLNTAKSLIYG